MCVCVTLDEGEDVTSSTCTYIQLCCGDVLLILQNGCTLGCGQPLWSHLHLPV